MWLILGPRSGVLQWVGGAVPLFRLYKPQQGRLRAYLATVRLRLPGRGEEWPSTEDSAKHCYTRGEDLGYTFRALETVVVAVQAKEGAGALLGPGDRPVCLRETWFYGEQGGPGEALFLVEATRRTGGAVLSTGRLQQVEVAVQAVVVVGRRSEQEARDEEDRRRQAELEAAMGIKDSCGFHSLSAGATIGVDKINREAAKLAREVRRGFRHGLHYTSLHCPGCRLHVHRAGGRHAQRVRRRVRHQDGQGRHQVEPSTIVHHVLHHPPPGVLPVQDVLPGQLGRDQGRRHPGAAEGGHQGRVHRAGGRHFPICTSYN
jgi:hypothetical protein